MEQGGTVEVLNNGDEFLPALLQSIDDARHSINFSVYIWEDGAFSNQVLEALIRKQSQGVPVRVLLDGLGGRKAPDDRFDELKKLGGRVEKFRTPKFGILDAISSAQPPAVDRDRRAESALPAAWRVGDQVARARAGSRPLART